MKQFIAKLEDKETVHSVFIARDKNVQTGKNGRPYLSMLLADTSGAIDARIWDNVDKISKEFENGDFVQVKGAIQVYQNRKQLIVHNILKAEPGSYDISELVKSAARPSEEMYDELISIVKEIKNEHIRTLVLKVLQEPDIKAKILICPAAKTIHHAYVGGLLEHILSICGMMKFVAGHYPVLDRDLLVFGAIFHDLGKIWELEVQGGIRYTDEGRLVGHLVLSSELIEKEASQILGFPAELKNVLKHIVLSHHGRLEYGSPKRPKLLEAFVVAAIDDFDSKMNTLENYMRDEKRSGASWSRYNPSFDRYFYLDRLPEEAEE